MMGTNPKVTVSSLASLVASVVATFLLVRFGVHLGDVGVSLVTGLVTLVATYAAGYVKDCEQWAVEYVAAHKGSQSVGGVSLPASAPSSNTDSSGDWA